MSTARAHAIVIGGGGTGAACAYDLALRGCSVTLLERGEFTSGTTGRHHGQLHCGARYALGDKQIARECMTESSILRRIVPEAIEYNEGLFVAVDEQDEAWHDRFVEACLAAGIPAEPVSLQAAHRLTPGLSEEIRAAVKVPDGSFDPYRLVLSFFAGALKTGRVKLQNYCEVTGINVSAGKASGVTYHDHTTGEDHELKADLLINAGGIWAGRIAEFAGCTVEVTPSPGTMTAVRGRLCDMVISRLHPAGDGDIIVPQRGLTIIGSTQRLADSYDLVEVPQQDISFLLSSADRMFSGFSSKPYHTSWAASRPLYGRSDDSQAVRSLSRDFICIDHLKDDGISSLFSIVGGKATTLRGMAEKVVDLASEQLRIDEPCTTAIHELPNHREFYHLQRRTL